ncbi:hypothetical protein GCM10027614_38320 [Micromonospora vulcania]
MGVTLHPGSGDPYQFGTEAFYAALGRAFVAMCAVVPFLFLIEAVDQGLAFGLDATAGIIPHRIDGLDGVFFSRSCTTASTTSTATASR